MTRMSRLRGPTCGCGSAKGAYPLARGAVARVLLFLSKSMSGALLVGALAGQPGLGCVLPPDLEPAGPDAGPSSTPVILSASPPESFAFPGPITIPREDSQIMVLNAVDSDLVDSLFVRLYVDYNRGPRFVPTPALADCQAAPSGDQTRIIGCPTNALCTTVLGDDNTEHVLEAVIADRSFILDSDPEAFGQPQYRAVADSDRAAFSIRAWVMTCELAQ